MKGFRAFCAMLALVLSAALANAQTIGSVTTTSGKGWTSTYAPDINDDFTKLYQAPYVMMSAQTGFSAERVLGAGAMLSLTDGGAGAGATFAVSDAELLCLGGLTSAADKVPYFTGSGTCALADLSSAFRTFLTTSSSANLRAVLTDEIGTGAAMFGLISTMADDLGCTGSQVVRRNSGDTAFECATVSAGGLNATDIDTSAELRAIMTDEIGTGVLVFLGTPADDAVPVGDSTSATTWRTLPNVAAGSYLTYATATNTFSTATDDDVPEAGDFGALSATSPITQSGGTISTSIATGRLVGRTTASAGVMEQITPDATLSLTAGALGVVDVTCTGCLGATEIAALDAGDVTTGTFADARIDGSLEADEVNPTLGTQTQGNYVASVAAGTGVAVTGTAGEGWTATAAFDFSDAGASPALAADESRFTSNATVPGHLVFEGDTADAFETRVIITDPTADRGFTIPNADSVAVQGQDCGAGNLVRAISATTGIITCAPDSTGAGGGDAIRVEDGDNAGTYTAAVDPDFDDSSDINFALNTGTSPQQITATIRADSVALTTDTTGNYAAGDAEAGNALTGDSATAFFTTGAIEVARGGNGAAPGGDDQVFVSSSTTAGAFATLPDSDGATQKLQYDQATNAFSAGTDDDVPDAGDFGALALTGDVTSSGLATTIAANSVALTTDTTGNYAAGDAEAGAALTGDSATAFFSAGSIEDARLTLKTESFCMALSDETTAITTGTAKVTMRMPYAFVLTNVRASVNTVSTSGLPTVDINEAGATIMTTNKLTIDANEKTSVTAATAAGITDANLADDAEMTFDVDTAGTGTKGLKVCLIGHQ